MKTRSWMSIVTHGTAIAVAFGLGWSLAVVFPTKQVLIPGLPEQSVPNLAGAPVVQSPPPITKSNGVQHTLDGLAKVSNQGNRGDFDKAIAAAIEKHGGDEFAQDSIRWAAGNYLETKFHDDGGAADFYRLAAEHGSAMIIRAANLRTSAYNRLARCVQKRNPEEAIQAYRRVIETFERLDTFPAIPRNAPPGEDWYLRCRESYVDAVCSLAELSEAAMKEVGYAAPIAYRPFPSEFGKEILWLNCYEGDSLIRTRRNLLVVESEYSTEDMDEKRRVSETLLAAAAILETIAHERSDVYVEIMKEQLKRPTRIQRRDQMHNQDLRSPPGKKVPVDP